ncbi:MAG: ABC transporter substrate-binding protein [Lachnospiraceae bacterium]|nr:ABC transporter substrate-binding protein [Lachnospiraceae bacterium]
MSRRLKRVINVVSIMGLIMASMTGCGTKETSNNSNTFKIGGLGPLTGSAASYGNSVKNGAEIAVEEINADGGVKVGDKQVTLELKFEDDEASPDIALTAYNAVMDWGAQSILGCVTSDACLAIKESTYKDGVLMLTPSGSASGCTEYDNGFRLCFTDPLQGVTMADLANELGYQKIAVIYNNSSDYSTGIMEAFKEEAEKNGAEIVACEAFAEGANDFNTQLTKIKGTDAQVIFVPAYYGDASYITTQAAELGMTLPYLGSDGWDGVLAQLTDPSVAEGAIFLSPFFAADEEESVSSFVQKYEEKFSQTPDQFAADGYDSVYVIAAALGKAGTTDSASIINAMTEITVDGITGSVSFTKEGEPNKGARFIEIKDGAYVAR